MATRQTKRRILLIVLDEQFQITYDLVKDVDVGVGYQCSIYFDVLNHIHVLKNRNISRIINQCSKKVTLYSP